MMRIAICFLIFLLAISVGLAPPTTLPAATAPSTRPAFTLRLMTRNFGPLGQLMAAAAAIGPARDFEWLNNQTDQERARIIGDLDTWSPIVTEVVSPDVDPFFREDCRPWAVLRPTGPGTGVGKMSASCVRTIIERAQSAGGTADRVKIWFDWTPGKGHEINLGRSSPITIGLNVEVLVEKPDMQSIPARESATTRFTSDTIELSVLPKRMGDATGKAEPLMASGATNLVIRPVVPDDDPVHFTVGLNGVLGATKDGTAIGLSTRVMGEEAARDARHVIGFLCVTTTEPNQPAVEHDIGFDLTFTVAPDGKPAAGEIAFGWTAGPEAAADPAASSQPTTGP